MKKETMKGNFGSARGQKFNPPVEFTFEVDVIETDEELVSLKRELSLSEQRKYRNAEEVTRARQAAQNAKLDEMGIEKQDINNNDQIRLREFYRVLMSSKKYDEETARQMASATLGVEWASE